MAESNYEAAVRAREKFDAYFLGLTFTILGLSVQTAHLGVLAIADAAEIAGWIALLTAGLAGLSRMERTSEIYRLFGLQDGQEAKVRSGQEAQAQGVSTVFVAPLGRSIPIEQFVSEAEFGATVVRDAIKPLQRRGARRYRLMKVMFVIGLLFLLTARAIAPVAGILHAIGRM